MSIGRGPDVCQGLLDVWVLRATSVPRGKNFRKSLVCAFQGFSFSKVLFWHSHGSLLTGSKVVACRDSKDTWKHDVVTADAL